MDGLGRGEVIGILPAHRDSLAERFGVVELALFGSFARDQATEASDIIRVEPVLRLGSVWPALLS